MFPALVTLLVWQPPTLAAQQPSPAAARTAAEVIDSASEAEWRNLDPENTIHISLPQGRVIIELAPRVAPRHVANVRALVRSGYFDSGAIIRSQDNYVVQWAVRPLAEEDTLPEHISQSLDAEFTVDGRGFPFVPAPDGDVYSPEAGFVDGFPAGRDPATGQTWMAHCYGVVGTARGVDPASGSGASLYVVIGQAPRHLDRNLSMVGRVVEGMGLLSVLPRGTGRLGFYESEDSWAVFDSVRMGSDLAPEERAALQIMRTDSPSFRDLMTAARSRHEDFFVHPADRIGLCNIRVPTRIAPSD